jgi:hypothetical protein
MMKTNEARATYTRRDAILKLLSDEEVARVSTAETARDLAEGDEYLDLEEPDPAPRTALGNLTLPMGTVLPRKAVLEETWRKILSLLSVHPGR